MSLLQDYSITCDKSSNYILNFTTTKKASASFRTSGTTNTITIDEDTGGSTSFSKNYGNKEVDFKFQFSQPGAPARRTEPDGELNGPL